MLYELAFAKGEGNSISAKSVAHSLGIPLSSLLRRLNLLEELGLIVRKQDPSDLRRFELYTTDFADQEIMKHFKKNLWPCDK